MHNNHPNNIKIQIGIDTTKKGPTNKNPKNMCDPYKKNLFESLA